MIRLHRFKLKGHPRLRDLEVDFTDSKKLSEDPFSSIIIGVNGTGKSFLLKTIADLFFKLEQLVKKKERGRIPYLFELRYTIGNNTYDIVSSKFLINESKSIRKENVAGIFVLKNRPDSDPIFPEGVSWSPLKNHVIELSEVQLPQRVIASTTQLNDRFTFRSAEDSSIYRYCGARRTARTISTKSFEKNIADSLYTARKHKDLSELLETTLVEFLGFQKHFEIHYRTKYSSYFYREKIDRSSFHAFYKNWEETTSRKSEPWGTWKYDQLLEYNPSRLDEIIETVNKIRELDMLEHRSNSDSKLIRVDLFDVAENQFLLEYANDLIQLDILSISKIEVKKLSSKLGLADTSAGENQVVMSLLNILANIENDSLILIDEPEISLHPNWQMQYISILKKMFREFNDAHFVISTHSHFLVSDLQPESSSITSLRTYSNEKEYALIEANTLPMSTYGWSAEDVLFNVFNVKSTRNYYVAIEIGNILKRISKVDIDKKKLENDLSKLDQLKSSLKEKDPLKSLLNKIDKEFLNNG